MNSYAGINGDGSLSNGPGSASGRSGRHGSACTNASASPNGNATVKIIVSVGDVEETVAKQTVLIRGLHKDETLV